MKYKKRYVNGQRVLTLREWAIENGVSITTVHWRWRFHFSNRETITENEAKKLLLGLRKAKGSETF